MLQNNQNQNAAPTTPRGQGVPPASDSDVPMAPLREAHVAHPLMNGPIPATLPQHAEYILALLQMMQDLLPAPAQNNQ